MCNYTLIRSDVDPSSKIGSGSVIIDSTIDADCHIQENVVMKNCNIKRGALIMANTYMSKVISGYKSVIGSNVTIFSSIGDYTKVLGNTFIPGFIIIGKFCFIGPGVVFINDKYPTKRRVKGDKKTIIEDEVMIGANATIGIVTIGRGSMIGMGSVVVNDIPSGCTAFGNPCKISRKSTNPTSWNTWGLSERP